MVMVFVPDPLVTHPFASIVPARMYGSQRGGVTAALYAYILLHMNCAVFPFPTVISSALPRVGQLDLMRSSLPGVVTSQLAP